ncbi:MAG: hypothetical protein JJE47_02465 [Acidimicrobiia bacterium]|nr:hypothetical protein [Acidimicrobiia bacterium]
MRRVERKIMKLNDQIALLREDLRLLSEELNYHQHLDDDAQRDAAFGDAEDRALAYETKNDRLRFERLVREVGESIANAEIRRSRLLDRLGDL